MFLGRPLGGLSQNRGDNRAAGAIQTRDAWGGTEQCDSTPWVWFARFRRETVVVSKSKQMVDLTMGMYAGFHVYKKVSTISLAC